MKNSLPELSYNEHTFYNSKIYDVRFVRHFGFQEIKLNRIITLMGNS